MDLVLEADVALVRGAHPHPTDDAIRVIIAAVYDSVREELRRENVAAVVRARAERKARLRGTPVPEDAHGWDGYDTYACRCEVCKTAAAARRRAEWQAAQAATLPTAVNNRKEWTGPELEIIARDDLSARQAALMLGRTAQGVKRARQRLREDPRKIRLAGIPEERP